MPEPLTVVSTDAAITASERLIRARIRRLLAELNANSLLRQAILEELKELGWKPKERGRRG